MSMLEKMARQLAMDALNRVQVDTYTNVVDEIWLYRTGNATYRVSDYPGISNEGTPVLTFADACEAMVAMMAEQAGALVVVPEDAPIDSHLMQIAQLLVDSADVPTDEMSTADEANIVQTVKDALAYLDAARHDNGLKRATILEMSGHLNAINALLAESPDMPLTKDDLQVWPQTVAGVADALRYLNDARGNCVAKETEVERLNNQIQRWNIGANELQDKYLTAQQEIGALGLQLSAAKRTAKRWEDEAANNQARYEGMQEALRTVLELAGVGK